MIKLKSITDSSWLIVDGEFNKSAGMISELPNKKYFMILGDEKARFDSKKEMIDFFQFDIFSNVVEKVEETNQENYINGYPVDYESIYPVYDHASGLPVFTKSETSEIEYCAGYYCIKFPKGWLHGFTPKWETLEKYGFDGPYKTEIECRARLSALKKDEKRKKREHKDTSI